MKKIYFLLSLLYVGLTIGCADPKKEIHKEISIEKKKINELSKEIYAKMYISNIEAVIEGEIFPWPEFKYEVVFMETFRLHIRGLANEKGLNYFQEKILNY